MKDFTPPPRNPSPKMMEFGMVFGDFYLTKNNGDYKKAKEEILSLCISHVEWKGNEVAICLARPGLFIGHKGKNLDSIQKHLEKKLNINKIYIYESFSLNDVLVPVDIEEYFGLEKTLSCPTCMGLGEIQVDGITGIPCPSCMGHALN